MDSEEEPGEERLILNWSVTDTRQLLDQIKEKIPKRDSISYIKRSKKLDWSDVTVGEHSVEECQAQWEKIVSNVRTVRLLEEVLEEAGAWVDDPQRSDHPKQRHPDFPKKPLTSYMRFSIQQAAKIKARHPTINFKDVAKKVAKKWEKLSGEDKAAYTAVYQAEKEDFLRRKAVFYKKHPEITPPGASKAKRARTGAKTATNGKSEKLQGPSLPKTPFDHYVETKISPDEPEANKKEQKEALKEKWAAMSDKRKAKYIEKSMDDEKRYKEELTEFQAKNPNFVARHRFRVSKSERNTLAKSYGRPEAPTGGNSGYTLFCHEFQQSTPKGADWMSRASAAWKKLSRDEQEEFKTRNKTAADEYRTECEAYLQAVPDERREDERKVLKMDIPQVNGHKRKKRAADSLSDTSNKRRAKSEAPAASAPPPPSGLSFYMMDQLVKFQKKHPDIGDKTLKQLMAQAFDKLSQEKRRVYEDRAATLQKMVV